MGSLIGQSIKDIELEHIPEDYSRLRILAIVVDDPETEETCRFIAELDRYERPCIRLVREKENGKA